MHYWQLIMNSFDARFIDCVPRIPDRPEPGNYVVVDVMHFSTTVVELFSNGADRLHVVPDRPDALAYRETNPEALAGGAKTDAFTPVEEYDFYNSPSYVQGLDVSGRPVSMSSTNGAQAVLSLTESGVEDVDVYIGSTTNAAALGRLLREDNRPTYLVGAGSKGEPATEDHVGAVLVGRYLNDQPLAEAELETYRELLGLRAVEKYSENPHPIRRRDVEYARSLNSRTAIPRLVGDHFVDVGDATGLTERPLATAA